MEIEGESLDDVLIRLYDTLPRIGVANVGSRGENIELLGVALRIRSPRARLSRSENRGKPFSALGELLWYLSGRNDVGFIKPYIRLYEEEAEDDGTVHGAYGPRLLAMRAGINQIDSVAQLLTEKPSSRRAVIQIFNAEDIASAHKEVPCTTTLQFFVRAEQLHMAATLRSNDVYWGLPHDVFCFTMLQEMMATRLGAGLGEYYQFVGSMHVYTRNLDDLTAYIDEGFHKLAEMPPMPPGNAFENVPQLLSCERRMRDGEYLDASTVFHDAYWSDLLRLLQAFWARGEPARLDDLATKFEHSIYRTYLESRRRVRPRHAEDRQT